VPYIAHVGQELAVNAVQLEALLGVAALAVDVQHDVFRGRGRGR